MRTTISIDDRLGKAAKRAAVRRGLSLSAFIARALQRELQTAADPVDSAPFKLITFSGSGVFEGIDLDASSALSLSDDESAFGHGR